VATRTRLGPGLWSRSTMTARSVTAFTPYLGDDTPNDWRALSFSAPTRDSDQTASWRWRITTGSTRSISQWRA
jgi:hypothetical protein